MSELIFRWVEDGGYLGIFLLMLLETVFPPIPSEVIMSLAGVVAARSELSLFGVIAAGTAGAMLGNVLWYWGAQAMGVARLRPLIERYGRWLTIDWAEIERAEDLFDRRGGVIVCIGRMLPNVRSLISIPAGLLRMRFLPFFLWSTAGSAVWTTALALAGWFLGRRIDQIELIMGPLSLAVMIGAVGWYVWRLATWRPARK